MKSFILLAAVLLFPAIPLSAQLAQVARRSGRLDELTTTIQRELETHGERVLGHETYHWSTRLDRTSNCQVEMSVRITSNFGETNVHTESVRFSLVAIAPYGIGLQKKWLQLSRAGQEKCIFSTTTCSKKTKDGIAVDCTTANQKTVDSFSLQLDGDVAASLRLERTFRQAVALCHQPVNVDF
jgi:hypothetical protein